jgi:hypothetical protein
LLVSDGPVAGHLHQKCLRKRQKSATILQNKMINKYIDNEIRWYKIVLNIFFTNTL